MSGSAHAVILAGLLPLLLPHAQVLDLSYTYTLAVTMVAWSDAGNAILPDVLYSCVRGPGMHGV